MQQFKNLSNRAKTGLGVFVILILAAFGLIGNPYDSPQATIAARDTPAATLAITATQRARTTNTPGATLAPSLTPTETPTGGAGGCPPHANAWHSPADEPCQHHHHGDNPRDFVDVFSAGGFDLGAWLDANGELFQPAWTPAAENPLGFVWVYYHVDGCQLFNNGGQLATGAFGCVTDFLLRLHDVGTAAHMTVRFHSLAYVIRSCNQTPAGQPGNQCGVLAGGGLTDYGILETPYKTNYCPMPGDPPGFVDLNQPPYRAIQTQDRGTDLVEFWSGLHPNAVNAEYYPSDPNALFGVAWSSTDAFQVWDIASGCNGFTDLDAAKAAAAQMPKTTYTHSNFSIFSVFVYSTPGGPFEGYADQFGHILPAGVCAEPGPGCIPITITGDFPQAALYNRAVDNTVSGPNDYNDPNLLPPWEDVP